MPRMGVALCIMPDFEPATYMGNLFFRHVVDEWAGRGMPITDLNGNDAIRSKVLEALATDDPVFVCGVGHGNACYSEDTEILTENGWKKFYELDPKERVATLNSEGELEYQVPTRYFKAKYRGKMFHISGRRIDLLVTPNHNLYVSWLGRRNGKLTWLPYRFIMAQDIGKKGVAHDPKTGNFVSTGTTAGHHLKFKRSAVWNCEGADFFTLPEVELEYAVPHQGRMDHYTKKQPPKKVRMEDWLRFFGIWLAEGSASLGDRKGVYIISITQNDDNKREIIKQWVDKVGKQVGFSAWEEASNQHSKAVKFKNKQVYMYLKQFGHAKDKYIPKEIKMFDGFW